MLSCYSFNCQWKKINRHTHQDIHIIHTGIKSLIEEKASARFRLFIKSNHLIDLLDEKFHCVKTEHPLQVDCD